MRRPDQARALSAASLIRHEANKKLTTMAALALPSMRQRVLLLHVLHLVEKPEILRFTSFLSQLIVVQ